MKHLVLIGFMGSGKTTLGKVLADELLLPFIDLDEVIEQQQGLSIARIFADFGEPHFRDLESTALEKAISTPQSQIIASGGGIVLRAANRQRIKDSALCLFLNAPPDVFLPRIRRDTILRPLAQQATDRELSRLWKERLPFYLEIAHHHIDAAQAISKSASIIQKWLKEQNNQE